MLDRLRCLVGGHAWPEQWPAWMHGGRGKFFRQRYCLRCGHGEVEVDG